MKLLEDDRKPDKNVNLSDNDRKVALSEADELWKALNTKDEAGEITKIIKNNPDVYKSVKSAGERIWRAPSLKSVTGGEYDANPRGGVPRLRGEPKLPKVMDGAGVLGDLLFFWQGVSGMIRGERPCDVMDACPVPQVA